MTAHVLVADDDPAVLSGLVRALREADFQVTQASTGAEALEAVRHDPPDVALLDIQMPDGTGLEVLPKIRELSEPPSVVLMTGMGDVPTAVSAMRQGAADFLEKPVCPEVLEAVLRRVLKGRTLVRERDQLRSEVTCLRTGRILGRSEAIRRVMDQVDRVARTPRTTVLIQGESGVGKELVARAVHEHSARSEGPFVALNCAALSESLLEAELFGYEAGAFTGGSPRGHQGLVAAAEGGSLFLDEIGELALPLQAKLLRVLQERVFRRVGGNADLSMDVRIIASTNRDLPALVEQGGFREDLFYRLNVMSLFVPPLRQRREDISGLAEAFLDLYSKEFGKSFDGFSPEAMETLEAHDWPGNVRELRNAIERAALLAPCAGDDTPGAGVIQREHFSSNGNGSTLEKGRGELLPFKDFSLKAVEKVVITKVLTDTGGNRSAAARVLGVNRTTLYNKIRTYGIAL